MLELVEEVEAFMVMVKVVGVVVYTGLKSPPSETFPAKMTSQTPYSLITPPQITI